MSFIKCQNGHEMKCTEVTEADVENRPARKRRYHCWKCDVYVATYEVPVLENRRGKGGPDMTRPAAVITYQQMKALVALIEHGALVLGIRDESEKPSKTGRRRKMPSKLPCSSNMQCEDPKCGTCKTLPLPGTDS